MMDIETLKTLRRIAIDLTDISDKTYLFKVIEDNIYSLEKKQCACTRERYQGIFHKGKHICTVCNKEIK